QRSFLPVLLGNVDTADRFESVALVAQRINDAFDLTQGHTIGGLAIRSGRQGPFVGVQTPIGEQIPLRVEQLPVESFQRQAAPSAFPQDIQYCFGLSHHAHLLAFGYPITWPPSPDCGRLSRPPWWGVTPTTSAGPMSP